MLIFTILAVQDIRILVLGILNPLSAADVYIRQFL
jgi:hypothetical protein